MKNKIKLGNLVFTSKAAIKKHASAVREKYPPPEDVTDPEDIAFLHDLIKRHIHAGQKIGCGIAKFFVDSAPNKMSICFWIKRTDDSTTDFGVPACLESTGSLNRQSLREAIKYSMNKFREENLRGDFFVSAYSGKTFPRDEAVVDHVVPFEHIVQTFFAEENVDVEKDLLTESIDGAATNIWVDPDLIERFVEYHDTFPRRIVHWRENLSDLRRKK